MSQHALGQPLAPPSLTREQALAVARESFAQSLFTHPFVVGYGASYFPRSIGGRFVGLIDVWTITITNVFIPRPGGRPGSKPPKPATTLVLYVDDKAGTVLGAEGL